MATQMVVLFMLVLAGFAAHKCGLMGGEFDKRLSNFVIQVTCPCLIISSTMGDTMPDRSHIPSLLGVGMLTYAVLIILAYIIPRCMPVRREDRGMYSFMLTFANVGFIGYPIVASIFGQSAVFYACILNAPNTLTIFIWGIMFVTGQRSGGFRWQLLCSPAMVATYISIIIVAAGWRAPEVVAINAVLVGMPVASFGTMFCMKYGRDETVMTQGTFLSTLLSVASIPLLAMLIG